MRSLALSLEIPKVFISPKSTAGSTDSNSKSVSPNSTAGSTDSLEAVLEPGVEQLLKRMKQLLEPGEEQLLEVWSGTIACEPEVKQLLKDLYTALSEDVDGAADVDGYGVTVKGVIVAAAVIAILVICIYWRMFVLLFCLLLSMLLIL
ncbi:hypothetical protein POM88_031553 [Heracleum sosnowskyi]|uniref:Uncharacterized protein n=1 Tax=Heracleum sosnowskyi TaxID=360622 RepID=A0AAD8MGR1_9APIA|nr:hypothetical protein POM88_031553 [Heracleum sosnowskyi]